MIPKKLGRFEVVSELGRGAMGVVYKGLDPKLDRTVALKVVQFGIGKDDADLQMKERFLVEARATGKLQHPNILTIYDAGDEGDLTYIAMEFLEGGNLEDLIKGNKFEDYDHIYEIVRQVADGLDHAHAKGIVHRDIKPANIMMAHGKIPKIADFGLARLSNSTLTATGTVLGTPSYMAPEQIRGRKVDGRADLFALGVIFYEMLTGEKPFGGDSITSVIYRVVNEEPIPLRKLNLDLPKDIELFMQRALAKEPSQRFQTGKEFAEGLKALQKGKFSTEFSGSDATQKMAAYKEGEGQEAKPKKNLLIIGAAAAGLLAVTVGVVFLKGGKKEAQPITVTQQVPTPVTPPPASPPEQAKPVLPPSAPQKAQSAKEAKHSAGKKEVADKGISSKTNETASARETPKAEETKEAQQKAESPASERKSEKKEKEESKTAFLTITSNPSGAKVYLNGKPSGITPISNKFELATYELKLEKKDYEPYTEKFTLNQDLKINAEMKHPSEASEGDKEEKKEGLLKSILTSGKSGTLIVSAGKDDKVTIDGHDYSAVPVELKGITIGKHNIFIVRKGKKPYLKTVTIKEGETLRVTPDFD